MALPDQSGCARVFSILSPGRDEMESRSFIAQFRYVTEAWPTATNNNICIGCATTKDQSDG